MPSDSGPIVVYYCTVALFFLGIAIPQTRVWGFNWWAYQPLAIQLLLILLAVGAGPLLWRWSNRIKQSSAVAAPDGSSRMFWTFSLIAIICFTGLYVVFPSTTHFLGDGYYLLNRMAHEGGTIKSWDIGATYTIDTTIRALGARTEANTLLAFRIVAVASGFMLLVLTALVSRRLFERFADRSLFFLGVALGGYTLQFFGYVENYALFILAVAAFTLLGLAALLGKLPRWLTIIPALVACGLHIFGLTLLPALLYILLHDKPPFSRAAQLSGRTRAIVLIAVGAVALGTYFYLFYSYYFFRFAFLPLIPDRFAVDHDYLLSPKHMLDFANLLILLTPGIGLFIVEVLARRRKWLWDGPDRRFLLLLAASTALCIYVFNPGHGMPRNWDLFALPGVPVTVLVFYFLLASPATPQRRFLSAALAVTLGFLLLVPRVASQYLPDVAIRHFRDYVELDRTRSRNARSLLTDYYRSHGDEAAAQRWNARAVEEFPEARLTNQGKQQLQAGHIDQAASLFRRAIEINPIFFDAYSNLATCYINKGQLADAMELLDIADGLNPLNASVLNNKATVNLRLGDFERAKTLYLEVLRIDSGHVNATTGLVTVSLHDKDDHQASVYLEMLGRNPDVPAEYFEQGAEACLQAGLTQSARLCFDIAVKRGAGADWQQDMIAHHPELQE